MVIQYCSRIWPLEGGVYQWTKFAFGPCAAFMGAWNFTIWALLAISNIGIFWATSLAYALGPHYAWMPDSKPFIGLLNFILFGFILLVEHSRFPHWQVGLALRGVHDRGDRRPAHAPARLSPACHSRPSAHLAAEALQLRLPLVTLMSLNLFSKVCNSALSGLEQVAVFAGETKNPGAAILKSAWIGAPITAMLYITMTGALLVYTPAANIDLVAPVPQVLAAAFAGGSGASAAWITLLSKIAILGLALSVVAQYSVLVAETARLPLVAAGTTSCRSGSRACIRSTRRRRGPSSSS